MSKITNYVGFVDDPIDFIDKYPFLSKIGGSPVWYAEPPSKYKDITCTSCNKEKLSFLMQIYTPLDSLAEYERSYYVFVCTKCNTKPQGWKVIKTMTKCKQSNQNNTPNGQDEDYEDNDEDFSEEDDKEEIDKHEQDSEDEEDEEDDEEDWGSDGQSNEEEEDWGVEGGDDWGVGGGSKKTSSTKNTNITTTTTTSEQLPEKSLDELIQERNKKLHEDQKKKKDEIKEQKLQQQKQEEEQNENDNNNNNSDEPVGFIMTKDTSNQYEEYYIFVDNEVIKKSVNKNSKSKFNYVEDSGEMDEWSGETYEYVKDRVFSKFLKRIAHHPNQILRYSFKGEPLCMSAAGKKLNEAHYACQKCKSQKVFEFQILSTIITQINHCSSSSDLDFSNVFIYTCQNHCNDAALGNTVHNDVIYVEELLLHEKSV